MLYDRDLCFRLPSVALFSLQKKPSLFPLLTNITYLTTAAEDDQSNLMKNYRELNWVDGVGMLVCKILESTGQPRTEKFTLFQATGVYLGRLRKGRGTYIPLEMSQRNSGSHKKKYRIALLKFSCHINCKEVCDSALGLFLGKKSHTIWNTVLIKEETRIWLGVIDRKSVV